MGRAGVQKLGGNLQGRQTGFVTNPYALLTTTAQRRCQPRTTPELWNDREDKRIGPPDHVLARCCDSIMSGWALPANQARWLIAATRKLLSRYGAWRSIGDPRCLSRHQAFVVESDESVHEHYLRSGWDARRPG